MKKQKEGKVGRSATTRRFDKKHVEPIPGTRENVAKALFGIKSRRKKKKTHKS